MYSRGNWIQGVVGWLKPLKIWMSILELERTRSGLHFTVLEVHRTCVRKSPGNRVECKALRDFCFFSLVKYVQSCVGNPGFTVKTSCALFNCLVLWSRAQTLEPN